MRGLVILLIVSVFASAPALACGPREASLADVDRVLAEMRPSDTDAAKVKKLRAQIVDQLARGDRRGAAASEAEAMTIMGFVLQPSRGGCGNWVRGTK
jgi:hypothetical protein